MPENGKRRGSGWLYAAGFILLLVAGVGAFILFTHQRTHVEAATQTLTNAEQKGPTVEIAIAHTVAGSDTMRLIGEARPFQTAIVYAKVGGYMRSITVDKGDSVRANQVMAVIESPETDQQYQAAVADAHNKELIASRNAALVKKTSRPAADGRPGRSRCSHCQGDRGADEDLEVLRAAAGAIQRDRHRALWPTSERSFRMPRRRRPALFPWSRFSETGRLRVYVYPDQAHAAFVHPGNAVTIVDQAHPGRKSRCTSHPDQWRDRPQDAYAAGRD